MEQRLRQILGPLIILGTAAVVVAAVAVTRSGLTASPGAGPAASTATRSDCGPPVRRAPDDPAHATWFTLRTRTDVNGVVTGNVVRVTRAGDGHVLALELPAEAFADGPYDGGALAGSDDGRVSTLRLLAPAACARVLRTASDVVIYRATVTPDGRSVITQHLQRGTRADRGLWIAPIGEPERTRALLGPLVPDDRFGTTWDTTFTWSATDDRLVSQSCTPSGCRFRILDPAGGTTLEIDDPNLGEGVGLAGDHLFAFADCMDFRPCRLLARNLLTGADRELHPAAHDAWLLSIQGRPRLLAADWDAGREDLKLIDPETGVSRSLPLPAAPAGLGPVRNTADGSIALPDGWIALAPGGRLPDGPGAGRLLALEIESLRLLTLAGGDE